MLLIIGISAGCQPDKPGSGTPAVQPVLAQVRVPDFQADSAYAYIEKQLAFGPRVPNTAGHTGCAQWLVTQFRAFGAEVSTQPAVVTAFDGTRLNMQNIIASYNPASRDRILLTAHWDTRPFADAGTERRNQPIPGANDGGSGVAVLLEIARQLSQQAPAIGVDIILWDAEDYGNPETADSYCLGSQYWASNKHKPGYSARYGINLDMVGASGATFLKEGNSMQYAGHVVSKVWSTAQRLGYGSYFSSQRANAVVDDHFYMATKGGIPTANIIDQRQGEGFFPYWHTHQDDLQAISRETLKAVGQTVLEVVYREQPAQ